MNSEHQEDQAMELEVIDITDADAQFIESCEFVVGEVFPNMNDLMLSVVKDAEQ